jgi:hypothetical protein
MAVDLYGPRLKVERAEQHIGELEDIFVQYVRGNSASTAVAKRR